MKQYFVTGTDTGVGKTFVAATLARRARSIDPARHVFAFKPLETGCTAELGEDQRELVDAAGGWQRGPLRGLAPFRLAAAPLVAARAESTVVDVEAVVRRYREGSEGASLSMLEGAGGWRVPITETLDMAGLARVIGVPVLVVARAGLGTINHSLLTLEAVERDGCSVAALVLSERLDEDAAFTKSNIDEIQRRWSGSVLVLGRDPAVLDVLL